MNLKQTKTLFPISESARLQSASGLLTRKYDGITATRIIGDAVILGEFVSPKSGGFFTPKDRMWLEQRGGFFAAFTLASISGENLLAQSTRTRWDLLQSYVQLFEPNMICVETVHDIAATLAAGAEGVCWHDWDAPWGKMQCIKSRWEGICRIIRTNGGSQSVFIEDASTGQPLGKVSLFGGKCDRIRIGSLIKLTGLCLTDAGLIREPRLCQDNADSWLVKY